MGTDEEITAKRVPVSTFVEMLRSDVVKFNFERKDGSVATVYGTTKLNIIANVIGRDEALAQVVDKPKKPGYITYFNMERAHFGCFAEDKFLGVIEEHAEFDVKQHIYEKKIVNFETFSKIKEMLECDWDEDCQEETNEEE